MRLLHRSEEAREAVRKGYQHIPRSSFAYARLRYLEACVEMDHGDYKAALRLLDRLLEEEAEALHDPDNEDLIQDVQLNRGVALMELGRPKEARALLEEALSFGAERERVCYYLGLCYFDLADYPRAKTKFREALELGLDPSFEVRARYYLGIAHFRLGAYVWAKQEFEAVLPKCEKAGVPRGYVIQWLVGICRGLGLESEAEKYARLEEK